MLPIDMSREGGTSYEDHFCRQAHRVSVSFLGYATNKHGPEVRRFSVTDASTNEIGAEFSLPHRDKIIWPEVGTQVHPFS
jgi:hypothetical protein